MPCVPHELLTSLHKNRPGLTLRMMALTCFSVTPMGQYVSSLPSRLAISCISSATIHLPCPGCLERSRSESTPVES